MKDRNDPNKLIYNFKLKEKFKRFCKLWNAARVIRNLRDGDINLKEVLRN